MRHTAPAVHHHLLLRIVLGLDSVEFLMAIEDAFGITIPNTDAEQLATPRLLADYLEGRLGGHNASVACRTQRAFYRVRSAVVRAHRVPREVLQPSTPWADVLPRRGFRNEWRRMKHVVGVPAWPGTSLFGRSPASAGTLGDTARFLATNAPAALMRPDEDWSRPEIERLIKELLETDLGIRSFSWNASFAQDLRVD